MGAGQSKKSVHEIARGQGFVQANQVWMGVNFLVELMKKRELPGF